jgi:hypothetical protein
MIWGRWAGTRTASEPVGDNELKKVHFINRKAWARTEKVKRQLPLLPRR